MIDTAPKNNARLLWSDPAGQKNLAAPKCSHTSAYAYLRNGIKVVQCQSCRTQTTLTEGTIFHSTKLALHIWFQAMFVVTQNNNISALELKRHIGVCYRTAWRIKHKLMQVMYEREETTVFTAVTAAGCEHQQEDVGTKRKSTDMDCFKWINTVLGNLKMSISGTYHAFNCDTYGYRYLGEHQYRFNRRFNLAAMFPRLCSATAKAGKRPEKWLRLALAED